MTLEQKNLILGFLAVTGLDKENQKEETRLQKLFSELIELLPAEHRRKGITLQMDLEDLVENVKFSYLGFGASLYEVAEEWNLDWTPIVAKEIKEQARENNRESA